MTCPRKYYYKVDRNGELKPFSDNDNARINDKVSMSLLTVSEPRFLLDLEGNEHVNGGESVVDLRRGQCEVRYTKKCLDSLLIVHTNLRYKVGDVLAGNIQDGLVPSTVSSPPIDDDKKLVFYYMANVGSHMVKFDEKDQIVLDDAYRNIGLKFSVVLNISQELQCIDFDTKDPVMTGIASGKMYWLQVETEDKRPKVADPKPDPSLFGGSFAPNPSLFGECFAADPGSSKGHSGKGHHHGKGRHHAKKHPPNKVTGAALKNFVRPANTIWKTGGAMVVRMMQKMTHSHDHDYFFYMQLRAPGMRGGRCIGFPGGMVDPSDKNNLIGAIIRELCEETGLDFYRAYNPRNGKSKNRFEICRSSHPTHGNAYLITESDWSTKCSYRTTLKHTTQDECDPGFSKDGSRHKWVALDDILRDPDYILGDDGKYSPLWHWARKSINEWLDHMVYVVEHPEFVRRYADRRLPE